MGSWLSPAFFPVAKKVFRVSCCTQGCVQASLRACQAPSAAWDGAAPRGCSLTTPQAGLPYSSALCSELQRPAVWRRDGLGWFQFLPKWCFHLITCPWHVVLSLKGGAASPHPSSCTQIPSVPDAALLQGALMSPNFLIPEFCNKDRNLLWCQGEMLHF